MVITIIGAGASGMMAALTAANAGAHKILLFERQQRPGRKLMATGNGRCNLTNTGASPQNYHGSQPGFSDAILSRFTPQDTLDFFHALGLLTVEEAGGRVYPLSNSANSVLDVLRFALEERGVELCASSPVREIRRRGRGYVLLTDEGESFSDRVIAACGGAAGAKLGGVTDGYELLKSLGHSRTKLYPALVQLTAEPEYPRALKGVRADAKIQLRRGDTLLAESCGELQFTERGVSGPAIFDLSRAASVSGAGAVLSIDLLREYDAAQVLSLLKARRRNLPELECAQLLTGLLHNRLGRMLIKYARLPAELPIGKLSDAQLRTLAESLKSFVLKLTGTEGFDNAQVTVGGIKTEEFDPCTLESRLNPGLYACGELLDVDADCGGYNLQWAWASGHMAGLSAAKK